MGTRRPSRPCWNPEVLDPEIAVWNSEEPQGSSLDRECFDWNPEAIREPGGSSLDFMRRTRNRLGNLGFPLEIEGSHKDPEFLGNPKSFIFHRDCTPPSLARLLPVPVWISYSAARKLATIEFLCCILLLQEVTDRLRGCWCGCYDPSARLTLLSTSGEARFDCSLYFTVILQ
ncbi:hypothetical protein F2Q69_00013494 [Brassica cretica]|uniref:Uncharacterized protein n=1 Tax=Brassica cretica TaxID=69181 RepID=A0A8S9R270_BRACR|nr:hypothetical protein F2Q69_00013494 [Brassica cretica]